MLGELPSSIEVNGREIPINTDFRIVLIVIQILEDPDLDDRQKITLMIDALIGLENVQSSDEIEPIVKACTWFIDGGKEYTSQTKQKPLMNWEQDEQIIFSAINNVAKMEVRAQEYMHWWTFLGYYYEIQEGLFSTVLMIRQKKAKNKKLEKNELEFYKKNKDLVDLKVKYSSEEKKEIERLNEIFS